MMPIRPNALAIAVGIHVLIVVAFLVARDWNAEPPPRPEVEQPHLTMIETVPPPPIDVPVVRGPLGGDPLPAPKIAPPRPRVRKVDVKRIEEQQQVAMVDMLTADSQKMTEGDLSSRRPSADLGVQISEGGGGVNVGGTGGSGGGTGGLNGAGNGNDLSAKPIPLDTTSASTLPYTKEAMRDHVEGDVTLVLHIDDAGIVTSTTLQRGIGHGLDEIAANVARRFTFKPALDREGKKTAGTVKWRFHFTRPT
jgi:TonB family protein